MHDAESRRLVIHDRDWHPRALTPDYKTSIPRSPSQALVSIPQSLSETSGPDFFHLGFGHHDNGLLLNFDHGGLPQDECIVMFGRVFDQYGKPVPHTLVEMWQVNTGGRYRHKNDRYLAPLDPNFDDVGRALADSEGHYYFHTIKPGPYPWRNSPNDWRPAHIHVSVSDPAIATRSVTQMYSEGGPLIPKCLITRTLADPGATQSLIDRLDMNMANPMDYPAYCFDIVLHGQRKAFFENTWGTDHEP